MRTHPMSHIAVDSFSNAEHDFLIIALPTVPRYCRGNAIDSVMTESFSRVPEPKIPAWRTALDKWEDQHPRLMWIVRLCGGALIAVALAAGAWEDYGPAIEKRSIDVLLLALLLLSALPWWFWLIVLGATVWAKWAWYHHQIRLRQEVIIKLLLEIKDSIGR